MPHREVKITAMRAMSFEVSSIMILLVFCQLALGKDRALKLSITGVEQYNESKPSRVDAQSIGHKPTLYYKLACGIGAENLEVGHVYQAAKRLKLEQANTLVISDVKTANGGIFGVACDIESVVK
jgi:hypothetical protein